MVASGSSICLELDSDSLLLYLSGIFDKQALKVVFASESKSESKSATQSAQPLHLSDCPCPGKKRKADDHLQLPKDTGCRSECVSLGVFRRDEGFIVWRKKNPAPA